MNDEKLKAIESDPVNSAALLRASFKHFIKVFHYYIWHKEFTFKNFHLQIIDKLQEIADGKQRNLIINMPPRLGKSAIMKYFVAWTYSREPKCNNIYTSYSDDLVRQFSGDINNIIDSPLYNQLFGITIKEDTNNKGLWQIAGGGMVRACSMGGSITGFGFGIANSEEYGGSCIIDDALKADNARSSVEKQHCITYFTDTLLTRRNNEKAPIIIIMQRLAVDDLVAYIKEKGLDFEILEIPIKDNDGKSIWEEKYSTAYLNQLERDNPDMFAAQFMQNPVIAGGNVIKINNFRTYRNIPDNLIYTKVFCDFAMTAKTSSDYSVFLLAGYTHDRKCYILDLWRNKWEVPQLTKFAFTLWQSFESATKLPYPSPRCFCIEDKASGTGVLQEFRQHRIRVEAVYPKARRIDGTEFVGDKYQRVCDILGEIEAGNVYIPHRELNKVWLKDFLKELSEFSADDSHAHDDMCFEENTLIATLFGNKKIKDIKVGDWIITPLGLSKVKDCGITGVKNTVNKFALQATEGHKIFSKNKFIPLKDIDDAKTLNILSYKEMLKWQFKKLLFSGELNIGLWGRKGIIYLNQQATQAEKAQKGFIRQFGNIIAAKPFLKGMSFTIKTVIALITTSIIWSVYQGKNILNYISQNLLSYLKQKKQKNIYTKSEPKQPNGIKVKKAESGTNCTLKKLLKIKNIFLFVKNAAKNLRNMTRDHSGNTDKFAADVSINYGKEILEEKKPVYNLTTDAGCYYANGILVSNCDCLVYAIKEMQRPKVHARF